MLRLAALLAVPFGHAVRRIPAASRRWAVASPYSPVTVGGPGRWLQHEAIPPTANPPSTLPLEEAASSSVGEQGEPSVEGPPLVSARTPKMRSRKFTMQSFYDLLPALEQGGVEVERRLLAFMNLCHGSTVVEAPQVKVQMAEEMWQALQDKGVRPSNHIYNILLRVYNANNHTFKPSDLLEKMQADSIFPNQGTFTLLIAAYCNQGNVSGATKLLEYMKTLDFPMSETIYASLVTGHARAGNMEAAERVIANMKATHQKPHNPTYTSLLCAYAERGKMEAIDKLFGDMRVENVFPSMVTYVRVMNALSQYGHGSLVSSVLDLMKNKEWLSADLRMLVVMCLCRGEVEAPRVLIEELARHQGLSKMVVGMYLAKCLEQGQSARQLLDHMGTLVGDMSSVPVYDSVISRLLFEHPPVLEGVVVQNQPPVAGALAAHPQGALWAKNLLEVYDHMPANEQGSWHYYPLLARHCSDVSVDELMGCVQQMVSKDLFIDGHTMRYMNTVMANANTTMEDYISTKLGEIDKVGSEDLDFPLLCLLYSCTTGNFQAALPLVNRFKKSGDLKEHTAGVINAIKSGYLVTKGHNDLVLLFKCLFRLPHPPKLAQCVDAICQLHVDRGKPVVQLLDFLSSLELSKVDVVSSKNYLFVMTHLARGDRGIFKAAYTKLKSHGHVLKPENYATVFKAAVRTGSYGIGKTVYDLMSPEVAKRLDVRNAYLLYLAQFRHSVLDAVELLDTMLAEGQTPSLLCWFRLIPEVMKADLVKGGELIERMIACGYQPNSTQRHRFLEEYVQQGCIDEAKEQFSIIKDEGWASARAYSLMAKVLAGQGKMEEIEELVEEAKEKGHFNEDVFLPVLVQVQLKSGNCEGALEVLQASTGTPTTALYPALSSMLVHCLTAGQPLDPIIAHMKSLPPATTNSLLFFACVDAHNEERARAVLQETDMLDRTIFDQFIATADGAEYLRVLKANDFHLKHIRCAYLMKSGYLMLNDEEGLRQLVQELDKSSKTDWLWKQL